MNSIVQNYSFVIISRQCNFVKFFSIDIMMVTSNNVHTVILFSFCKQTSFVILMRYTFLNNSFLNAFTFLCFHTIFKHFIRVQLGSKTYKFFNLFTTSFIFKHTNYFFVNSSFYVRWMIIKKITSIKLIFNIPTNIVIKIISMYFIS